LTDGFQWLDGSFVENVEAHLGRPPNDIDVVTFFRRPVAHVLDAAWIIHAPSLISALFFPPITKANYLCDAYAVDLDAPSEAIVMQTRYWFGLFSHRRVTQLWKGMVQIPLAVDGRDAEARAFIERVLGS